jgi:hypothetical protein
LAIAAQRATDAEFCAQIFGIEALRALKMRQRLFIAALRLRDVTQSAPHAGDLRHQLFGGIQRLLGVFRPPLLVEQHGERDVHVGRGRIGRRDLEHVAVSSLRGVACAERLLHSAVPVPDER